MTRARFNSKWTKHIRNDVERENFEKTILASRTALDRLHDLIREELSTLDNQEASISDYTDAAWSHKQAHRNGERAFARKMVELLTFSK